MSKYWKALSLAATYGSEIMDIYAEISKNGYSEQVILRLKLLLDRILQAELGIHPGVIIKE